MIDRDEILSKAEEKRKEAMAAKASLLELMPAEKRDEARGLLEVYVSWRLAMVHKELANERNARLRRAAAEPDE